ncbi:phage tail protein [Solibacillus silvestris]|uniref:phage tail protein n=1 Tax=Solibacillus silvestris TaxID=76853 RepID=UPI003F7ED271
MITVKHDGNEIPINYIKSANRRFPMNDIPEMNMIVVRHKDNPAYPYLNEEAIIVTPDDHEWRIKVESEVTHYKNLNSQHILMDLTNLEFNQLLEGPQTPRELLSAILDDTGFSLDLNATGLNSVTVSGFGRKNCWQLLKEACELLNAEFTVLPGRVICIRKALSSDKGKQYRFGYNLKNVTKKTNSTDIVTHVTVNYGEKHSLSETFVSPNAENYDQPYYGDIINDERITDRETAKKRAEIKFKDIDLSYELDIAQIGNDVELGETVHTTYEPLNDLNITTRILKLRDDWNGDEFILTEATVGNYVFKTANQILIDQINDTEKDVTEKIDETKEVINKNMHFKFRETEEKMLDQYTTVTSEYTSAISISAKALTTDFNEKVTTVNNSITAQYTKITAEYNSQISQTAQQIRSEVNASVTSIGTDIQNVRNDVSSVTQRAGLIESRVNSTETNISSQGTRIASAESIISQQAAQISQRVSYTDFTGSRITSLINQDPYAVSISASRINLTGAVVVNGKIEGATSIDVSNDITVGTTLQIGQNWQSSYPKAIRFAGQFGTAGIAYNNGDLTISALSNINLDADRVNILGTLTGNINASSVNGITMAYSTSGGKKYMTFRQNGAYLGQVEIA